MPIPAKKWSCKKSTYAVEFSKSRDHPNADPSLPSKVNLTQEDELLKGYYEVFTGLGCLPGEHTIEIDHSFTPVVHHQEKYHWLSKNKSKKSWSVWKMLVLSSNKQNQQIGLTAW